jgi:hypothetical protein
MQQGDSAEIHGRGERGDTKDTHRRVGGADFDKPPTEVAPREWEA